MKANKRAYRSKVLQTETFKLSDENSEFVKLTSSRQLRSPSNILNTILDGYREGRYKNFIPRENVVGSSSYNTTHKMRESEIPLVPINVDLKELKEALGYTYEEMANNIGMSVQQFKKAIFNQQKHRKVVTAERQLLAITRLRIRLQRAKRIFDEGE